MKQLFNLIILFFIMSLPCFSQDKKDDTRVLYPEDFYAIVKKYHPVVKQADISIQMAAAEILMARSGFDPSLYFNSEEKTFDGKYYFRHTNTALKIPTWYGIELKTGVENNGGQLLNSEITPGESSYLGISIPVAKNLLMDKRRGVLQQAKLFRLQTEADRENSINNLLFESAVAYWNWVKEYQLNEIIKGVIKINKERFELVKIGFRQGDRPAIDTIEALVQLQQFQFMQSENTVRLQNAALELSGYLWLENNTYYTLAENTIPDPTWFTANVAVQKMPVLPDLLNNAVLSHPQVKIYNNKISILNVEKKIKFQSLLPGINFNATLLNKGYNVFKNTGPGFYNNNNKFGIDIGMPLRLSEGRGAYKLTKLKIQETNFGLSMKQQEIENKIKNYYNEMIGLQNQVNIIESVYKNYKMLENGESTRFKAGESSLFMLNSRENKTLESLQKLTDLKTKYYKSIIAVEWAAGMLK